VGQRLRGRKRVAIVLTVVGLAVGATVVYAAVASGPDVLGARFAGGPAVTVPLQQDAIAVRVRTSKSASVVLRVKDAGGKALTNELTAKTSKEAKTFSLKLNALGAAQLGRCASAGAVKLEVRTRLAAKLLKTATAPVANDAVRCAPLRWAPPVLEAPETLQIGTGETRVKLENRDYILKLPTSTKTGGLAINGGRNIVILGGHITLPASADSGNERRAIMVQDATGTVHIEGVLIDASGGGSGDGIAIDSPEATVQIENVRAVGLRGSKDTVHADVIQPWGGVRELRVDRLTGSSTYQGLQIPIDLRPIGSANLSSIDLTALPGLESDGGGHMLWLTKNQSCLSYPVTLANVWVTPRSNRQLDTSVWPQGRGNRNCSAAVSGSSASWPGLPVQGTVQRGTPKGGQFVPWGLAGVAYKSPGYAPQ
jgi:hypothetical protein